MNKSLKNLLIPFLVILCVIALGIFCWYEVYRGTGMLSLRTEASEALQAELKSKYDNIDQVQLKYWFPNNLEVKCFCNDNELGNNQAQDICNYIFSAVSATTFQSQYAQKYSTRYKTDDTTLKVVMLYLYEKGNATPQYRYSSIYPFEKWTQIN